MNESDSTYEWDDLSSTLAEARPLATKFEMLGQTVENQRRVALLALVLLFVLLWAVLAALLLPVESVRLPRDVVFAIAIVVTFGFIYAAAIYYKILTCLQNVNIAQRSLERELKEAEYALMAESEKQAPAPDATGRAYAA